MPLCIKLQPNNWQTYTKINHWLRQCAAIRLSEPNGAHSLAGG